MLDRMCQENSYAKMEKLGAEICRCTRQGLIVIPYAIHHLPSSEYFLARIRLDNYPNLKSTKLG